MGEAGFPSLVIMSLELICFVSSFAKFSLLIVVYNMGFQSLRTDLCLLYSIMCCSYFFFFVSLLTVMNPVGSFDMLLTRAARRRSRPGNSGNSSACPKSSDFIRRNVSASWRIYKKSKSSKFSICNSRSSGSRFANT